MTAEITELTRPQADVLVELAWRAANHPDRPCWLADTMRGRYLLVVPTANERAQYIAVRRYNGRTLYQLEAAGLIEYGTEQPTVPAYIPMLNGDTRQGCTVRLTETGRKALGGEG